MSRLKFKVSPSLFSALFFLKQSIFHGRLTLLEFTLALVFLFRNFPSKQDVDVLRAMGNMTCDPMEYPFITRWKRYMESFPKTTINR